jgi:hypothetical protein
MANNAKNERIILNSMQLNVDKVGLGVRKSADTPDLLLVGVVSDAGTAGAGTTGGLAADKVFTVEVAGTTYYIPMYTSNADA